MEQDMQASILFIKVLLLYFFIFRFSNLVSVVHSTAILREKKKNENFIFMPATKAWIEITCFQTKLSSSIEVLEVIVAWITGGAEQVGFYHLVIIYMPRPVM